jgi:probable HAF family extracellular repeat protein
MSNHLSAAESYDVIDLGLLEDIKANSSFAYAINDNGLVVGYAATSNQRLTNNSDVNNSDSDSSIHAFLFSSEQEMRDLGVYDNSNVEDGTDTSLAFGINNQDIVVGSTIVSSRNEDDTNTTDIEQAAYFENNQIELIPNFSSQQPKQMRALSINDSNKVVGYGEYDLPDDNSTILYTKGFIYDIDNETLEPITGILRSNDSERDNSDILETNLNDINNNNLAVGWAEVFRDNNRQIARAMYIENIDEPNNLIEIPITPNDHTSIALAVNQNNRIVGQFVNDSNYREAFYFNPGDENITSLGVLNDKTSVRSSIAYGINDQNQIVGSSYVSAIPRTVHAFIYENGEMIDLNDRIDCKLENPSQNQQGNPDWVLYSAQAINNDGYIVGYGVTKGEVRAFMLKPREGSEDRPAYLCSDQEENTEDDSGSLPIHLIIALLIPLVAIRKKVINK